ncbi:hypothetical protein U27_00220 [Candidatus Vecturithrix granuli]|uniref:Uncharacterized protein n=1 Tax=Vecturithrix granuli TaxID=1499967 RepID=A0A081C6X4_VECG1|nr:hypothetical protein U27_00220 [Candidatus Vecturithrix granuli]
MVKHKKYVIFIIFLATGIGIAAILYAFTNQTYQVKQRFASVAKWVAKDGDEPNLAAARKIQQFMSVLAETCRVKDPSSGVFREISGRETAQKAVLARNEYRSISLKFHDLEIAFPEKNMAKAITTARIAGTSGGGELYTATYELECTLHKTDEGWVFHTIEIVELLEK